MIYILGYLNMAICDIVVLSRSWKWWVIPLYTSQMCSLVKVKRNPDFFFLFCEEDFTRTLFVEKCESLDCTLSFKIKKKKILGHCKWLIKCILCFLWELKLFYIAICRIRVPYPLQWGRPTFNAGDAFAMMASGFVAVVEVWFIPEPLFFFL